MVEREEFDGGRRGFVGCRFASGRGVLLRVGPGLELEIRIQEPAAGRLEPQSFLGIRESDRPEFPGRLVEVDESGVADRIPAGEDGRRAGDEEQRQGDPSGSQAPEGAAQRTDRA